MRYRRLNAIAQIPGARSRVCALGRTKEYSVPQRIQSLGCLTVARAIFHRSFAPSRTPKPARSILRGSRSPPCITLRGAEVNSFGQQGPSPSMLLTPISKLSRVLVWVILALCMTLATAKPVSPATGQQIIPRAWPSLRNHVSEGLVPLDKHPRRAHASGHFRHWGTLTNGWNM